MPGVVVPRPRGRAGAGRIPGPGEVRAVPSGPYPRGSSWGTRAGGGIRVEVPNFFAGKGERSRGTEAEGLEKRLMERALPPLPPQASSHAVPAGLRSLFLMEMRGGGGQEGGERSRLGHCGSPLPTPRSPPPPCGSLPAPSRPGGADPAPGPRERLSLRRADKARRCDAGSTRPRAPWGPGWGAGLEWGTSRPKAGSPRPQAASHHPPSSPTAKPPVSEI